MAASEEDKLPPSFSGFKSQKFLHESSYDGVSGAGNDEQSLNDSASVFHLWPLEAFSWFQNHSILLVNASCKRRALIIEDEIKLILAHSGLDGFPFAFRAFGVSGFICESLTSMAERADSTPTKSIERVCVSPSSKEQICLLCAKAVSNNDFGRKLTTLGGRKKKKNLF